MFSSIKFFEVSPSVKFVELFSPKSRTFPRLSQPLLGRASTSLKARWATLGITLVSATKTSNRLSVSSSLWVNHKMNDDHDDDYHDNITYENDESDFIILWVSWWRYQCWLWLSCCFVRPTFYFRLWDSSEGFKGLPGNLRYSPSLQVPSNPPPPSPPSFFSSPPVLSLKIPPSSKMNTGRAPVCSQVIQLW